MDAFVRAVNDTDDEALTAGRNSLESHLMAFAAEEARLNGTDVSIDKYRRQAEAANSI